MSDSFTFADFLDDVYEADYVIDSLRDLASNPRSNGRHRSCRCADNCDCDCKDCIDCGYKNKRYSSPKGNSSPRRKKCCNKKGSKKGSKSKKRSKKLIINGLA